MHALAMRPADSKSAHETVFPFFCFFLSLPRDEAWNCCRDPCSNGLWDTFAAGCVLHLHMILVHLCAWAALGGFLGAWLLLTLCLALSDGPEKCPANVH